MKIPSDATCDLTPRNSVPSFSSFCPVELLRPLFFHSEAQRFFSKIKSNSLTRATNTQRNCSYRSRLIHQPKIQEKPSVSCIYMGSITLPSPRVSVSQISLAYLLDVQFLLLRDCIILYTTVLWYPFPLTHNFSLYQTFLVTFYQLPFGANVVSGEREHKVCEMNTGMTTSPELRITLRSQR